MIKNMLVAQYKEATELNHRSIESLFEKSPEAIFLDLGCDDGVKTVRFGNIIGTQKLHGVEVVDQRIKIAETNGVQVKKMDLNNAFDFQDNSIDVIHSNQVIEHLGDIDNYTSEIHRVLKPGGYTIISTENGSSWCNIFAAILGWQTFSLTNMSSKKAGIGNPFALHGGEEIELSSWTHKTIFNYRGLKEFFEAHDFTVENIMGAGYFPLPSVLGKYDVRRSHFITIKVAKK